MARNKTYFENFTANGVARADQCKAISFFRPSGTNPVYVDDFPLEEGQTLSINQPVGDVDISDYKILFGSGEGQPLLMVTKIIEYSPHNTGRP